MKRENINIAFAFDERVVKYAAVAIASLLKNRGDFHYDIYTVVPDTVGGGNGIYLPRWRII